MNIHDKDHKVVIIYSTLKWPILNLQQYNMNQ